MVSERSDEKPGFSTGLLNAQGASPRIKEVNGFELLERIGQGGSGTVFKARQRSLDRIVALKLLPPSIAKNQTLIERFQREARASAKLTHPNIVQGIDVGFDPVTGLWYFAMEYVDGPTLRQVLKEQKRLPETRALEIVRRIATALEHVAEHKMVHRDIKPDNIILDSRGTPKLTDLGLARHIADDANLTQEGQAVGTPNYMAPEQVRGAEDEIDIRTDLYALGATLFHLVTGQTPFSGPTTAVILSKHLTAKPPLACEINPDVTGATSRVIGRLLEKDRAKRIQTPTELIRQIDRILKGDKSASAALTKVHSGMRPAIGRGGTTGPRSPVTGLVSGHRRGDTGSTGPLPPMLRRGGDTSSTGPLPPTKSGYRSSVKGPPIDTAPTASQQPLTTGVRAPVPNTSISSAAQAAKKSSHTLWPWIGGAAALIAVFAAVVFSRQTQTPKTVEAPHVPAVTPQPIVPIPTPATPVVQPLDREERAKAALDAALEVQKTKPADFPVILDALAKAQEQTRGTSIAAKATEALSAAQKQWSGAFEAALKGLQDAASELAAKNDFAGALEKLSDGGIPENLRVADWRNRVAPARQAMQDAAAKAADKIIEDATARAQPNTVEALQAAIEQLKQVDPFPPIVPAKAKAGELRTAWLAALEKVKKEEETARKARLEKAQEALAAIRKELAPLLQQNRFAAANELLDKKLRDSGLADAADLLKQEKADIAAGLAIRQSALAALRNMPGKTVSLKRGASQLEGAIETEAGRNDVLLKLKAGPVVSVAAETLDAGDVDAHAPADANALEDLRRRGLLFLFAGDTERAKGFFQKAQAGGLATAAGYLERIETIELGEIEVCAKRQWAAAEALFNSKQYKEARTAYLAFQATHAKTKTCAQAAGLLKERFHAIDLIIRPVLPSLKLWFKLDEKEGTKAANAVEKGVELELTGGTWIPDGKFGGALSLNGQSDYAITAASVGKEFPEGDVTIAVWIKPAAGGVVVDELGHKALEQGWHDSQIEVQNDGEVRVRVWPLAPQPAGKLTLNEWHHVVVRYSKKDQTVDGFVDGVKSPGSVKGDKQWNGGGDIFYAFGSRDGTNMGHGGFFKGALDDIQIYSRALTDAEVKTLAGVEK